MKNTPRGALFDRAFPGLNCVERIQHSLCVTWAIREPVATWRYEAARIQLAACSSKPVRFGARLPLAGRLSLFASGCDSFHQFDEGSRQLARRTNTRGSLEGRATGTKSGQRVVLYAKSGVWWVQPTVKEPFTQIQADSTWRSFTHLGTEYAALLVDPDFVPPSTMKALPVKGASVVAVASLHGRGFVAAPPAKTGPFQRLRLGGSPAAEQARRQIESLRSGQCMDR